MNMIISYYYELVYLFHLGHWICKNPSIANCPEYVPVIVEDCPAANMPTAQIYVHAIPNVQPKNTPPLNRLDSIRSCGLKKYI